MVDYVTAWEDHISYIKRIGYYLNEEEKGELEDSLKKLKELIRKADRRRKFKKNIGGD